MHLPFRDCTRPRYYGLKGRRKFLDPKDGMPGVQKNDQIGRVGKVLGGNGAQTVSDSV